jgi:hypothetical protein
VSIGKQSYDWRKDASTPGDDKDLRTDENEANWEIREVRNEKEWQAYLEPKWNRSVWFE